METESLSTLCRQENDSMRFSFHLYFLLNNKKNESELWNIKYICTTKMQCFSHGMVYHCQDLGKLI